MLNISRTIIAGNLTKNPEVLNINETTVCKCTVAVNTKTGDDTKRTDFIDVEIWGKRGEAFAKFHSKGTSCYIEGTLRVNTWEDKDTGKKRSKMSVHATNWEFNQSKKASSTSAVNDNEHAVLKIMADAKSLKEIRAAASEILGGTSTEVKSTDVEHTPFN